MRPFVIDNVRRQEDVTTESGVPAACFDECNNASLEAQTSGKDPALCDRNSAFGTLLYQCTDCVYEATKSGNSSSDLFPSAVAQWVGYCAEQALSSNEYTLSTASMDMSTTTTPEPSLTPTVSETAASTPDADMDGLDTNSPNTKVIVPAVVVPVVVCLIAAAAVIWALMRRRRRRQMQQDNGFSDGFDGKAQLHADEFRPELEAVTPAKEKSTDPDEHRVVAELPARELVGSEMDATNQTEERRASG